jgi:hypothetical protein
LSNDIAAKSFRALAKAADVTTPAIRMDTWGVPTPSECDGVPSWGRFRVNADGCNYPLE